MKKILAAVGKFGLARKNHLSIPLILVVILLLGSITAPVFASTQYASISGLDDLAYTILQSWTYLDTSVSVNSASNDWTSGYIDVGISSSTVNDQLRLISSGQLSITGDAVSWSGTRIGTIDPVRNGVNGQPLRINFSASLLNSGFETGDFSGWTVNNTVVNLPGDTANGITTTATVQTTTIASGTYAAKLELSGQVSDPYGTAHGPEITSDRFYAQAGNTISLKWNAQETSDNYDVYGYLQNPDTGAQQQLFYERGATTDGWKTTNTTVNTTVCPTGTCGLQFRFLAGTQDGTGGMAVGSILYIDGINVVTATATDAAAQYIVDHIEYRNTTSEAAGVKTYTLTLQDASSGASDSANINISKAGSTTNITNISPTTTVFGQNYSVFVSVSSSYGTPTGSVAVDDGTGNSCTVTLSGGTGSCALPSTAVGVKTISANYPGTALGWNGSSASGSHTVNQASSSLALVSSANPSSYGQTVTFTATASAVAPASGIPSGSVQFSIDDSPLGSAINLNGSGVATLTLSNGALAAGSHSVKADYSGSVNFAVSSKSLTQTVNKVTPTVAISADPAIPTYAQDFDVTVTVSSSAGTPTGTVNIGDGSNSCSGVALTAGSATCTFAADAAGARTISASYAGDANFNSNNNTAPLTIQKGSATVTAAFDNFTTTNTAAFKFNGDARVNSTTHTIELTRNVNGLYGTAWWLQKVNLGNNRSFSTLFSFFMRNGSSQAADGLTFTIQTESNSAGSSGGGLGYQNIKPSIGVEYDTYYNVGSDPNANHIGLDVNGDVSSIWTANPVPDLNNGTTYYSWVDYDGSTDTMQIRLGASTDRNAATVLFNDQVASHNGGTALYDIVGADVYVGFTAATGAENQEHHIGSFYFNNDYIAGGIQPININYATHPATITLEASPASLYAASPMTTGSTQSTITVCTLDASGNGMSNETVTLSTTDGTLGSTSVTTGGAGCGTTTLNASSTIGVATIHASAAGGVTDTLEVNFLPTPPTAFTSPDPASSVYGASYSHTFTANGYYTPTFSVVSGSLPEGLSLNSSTGVLSGIPSVPGAYTFTVRATNSGGTVDHSYSLFIDKATTSLNLESSINPSVYGNNVTFTATLSVLAPSLAAPVGPVQLSIDSVNLGSPISLNAEGSGSRNVPYTALWPDVHTIQVNYAGTVNFKSSTVSLNQTVQKAVPVLTLTPNRTTMTYGESFNVDITLEANPASIGIPSGTAEILLNGVQFGDALTLDASGRTHALGLRLPAGANTVTVNYSGDDYFASVSDPIANPVTINKANTTSTITGFSPTSPVVGQPTTVSISVTPVAPGAGDPTGEVTVGNGTETCLVTLAASDHGLGSCVLTPSATGNPDLTASYDGDSNFNTSSANPIDGPVVSKANSRFVSHGFADGNSVVVGQPVTVVATVGAVAPGSGIPGGKVTVSYGTDSCEITLDESGSGSCAITPTRAGSASLTWNYQGDSRFNELVVTEPSTVLTVAKANTTTAIASSDDSSVYGQPVTFTATVAVSAPGAGSLSGEVQFTIDGQPFGDPVDLVDGHATSSEIDDLSVASHLVKAQYIHDSNFNDSTSGNLTQTVAKATSTLRIVSETNPSLYGNPVTVTAYVEPVVPSQAIPTGNAQFMMDGVNYGAPIPLNGEGHSIKILPYTALWPGNHTVTAVYAGDSHFSGSNNTASPLIQVVQLGQVQMTLDPAEQVSLNGQAVSFHARVAGMGSNTPKPSGRVQFSVDEVALGDPVALDADGEATSPAISSLGNGSHQVTVDYAGDEYYQETSADFAKAIMVTQTVVSFTGEAPAHAAYGAPYTHTFSANGYPAPSFGVAVGSLPPGLSLNATSGVLTGTPTAAGDFTFTLEADNSYTSATQEYTLTVEKAATSVAISQSTDPVVAGQTITFTAAVSPLEPGSLPVAGRVQFKVDGANLGSPVDLSEFGSAISPEYAVQSVGDHVVTAVYQGDANNAGSTSPGFTQKIDPANTTTSLASSAPITKYGEPVHFTAQVASVEPGATSPTGSVQFTVDGADWGDTLALTAGSATSPDLGTLSVGEHSLQAVYSGDSSNLISTSSLVTQTVTKGEAQITVGATVTPSVYGQAVRFTVTVDPAMEGSARPTGPVQFRINGEDFDEPVELVDGAASSSPISNLVVGDYAITAEYGGDASYAGKTAPAFTQTVEKAQTTITLTADVTPSIYGQPVDYTVTVTPTEPGSITPQGQVQFTVDGEEIRDPIALVDGTATIELSELSVGEHTLGASYAGDANSVASSGTLTHTIQKAETWTRVAASIESPIYGQPLQLTAAVSPLEPGSLTVAGQVQFQLDGEDYGDPVSLNAEGQATSPSTTGLDAGTHSFEASYLGDANNTASASKTGSLEVGQSSSTIEVVSSAPTAIFGQPVSFTATVEEIEPSQVTPQGQVQFSLDGEDFGGPVALSAGQAVSQAISTLAIGNHTFSAEYLGDANTTGSMTPDPDGTQTVEAAPTQVHITSSLNPAVYGNSVTMTVTVEAVSPSLAVPAGSVRLSIDGVPFGSTMTLDAQGEAARTVPYLNLWPGHHDITAVYTPIPDVGQFLTSNNTASPLDQQINKASPVISITPSLVKLLASQPVSYTLQVAHVLETQGTPKGTVQLIVDGDPVGSPLTLDAQGSVTSGPIHLGAGDHAIAVSYSGDDYFLSIPVSAALEQTVQKIPTTTQIVSVSPTSAVIGQEVTVQVRVTPEGAGPSSLSGTVTLGRGSDSCEAALTADGNGSCALVPTSLGESAEVSASYAGTEDYEGSEAEPFGELSVAKADSMPSLVSVSKTDPLVGERVTITVAVAPVAPGFAVPGGTLEITDGSEQTCTANLTDGTGSCEMAFASAGPAFLQLSYSGDEYLNASQLEAVAGPTVKKAQTRLKVSSLKTSSVYGEPVSFTASLAIDKPGAGMPGGAVQFAVDGANLGEPVVLVENEATSPQVLTLSVGAHTYSATYLGDSDFTPSTASADDQAVSKAGTSIGVSTDVNPSTYGIPVLATAAVTGSEPSQAIPTGGMVQFVVDGVNYGAPAPVDGMGHASKLLPYTAVWAGSHHLTVFYQGSSSFEASDNSLSPYTQVVEKGLLTITLESSEDNPVFGQPVHFTAGVDPTAETDPIPTGTVQFAVDGENLGSPVALDEAGLADSAAIANLAVGNHIITLTYLGDDFYQLTTVEINPGVVIYRAEATPSITSIEPLEVVVGQPVEVRFHVSAVSPGAGIPGGQVTITNGVDGCTGTLNEEGAGSCELISTAAGSPGLSIRYAGNTSFAPAAPDGATKGPQISPADTMAEIIEVDPADVVVGQPYTVSVVVTANEPSTTVPHGNVTISNGTDTCSATITKKGIASCAITPIGTGSPDLTAVFYGNADYNDSPEAANDGPTVSAADTLVSLTLDDNPILPASPTRFRVVVGVHSPGSGTPTGQVQFRIDGEDFGDPVDLVGGAASSPEASLLNTGLHAASASYLGSSAYNPSESGSASLNVVEGNTRGVVKPGEATLITFSGTKDGQPISIRLEIPAGAVDTETTLVFQLLQTCEYALPEGKDFAGVFTLDAYQDGELLSGFRFNQPVTISIAYPMNNWKESSLDLDYWTGSTWADDGIQIVSIDQEQHVITATISHLSQFVLTGQHEYKVILPVIYVSGVPGK